MSVFRCFVFASVFFFALFPLTSVSASADLYLQKSVVNFSPEDGIHQGDYVEYLLTYRNNGWEVAQNVQLEDYYANTTNFYQFRIPNTCHDTGRKIVCDLGNIEPGFENSIRYFARVSAGSEVGHVTTYASLSSPTADADTGDNRASVRFRILSAEKSGMFSFQDLDRNANVISNENALVKVNVGLVDTIATEDFQKDALTIDIRPDENLFIGPTPASTETTSAMEMEHQEDSQNTESVTSTSEQTTVSPSNTLPKGISSPQTGVSNSILAFLGFSSLLFGFAFVLARRKNMIIVENA